MWMCVQVNLLEAIENMDQETFEFRFGEELVYTTLLSDGQMVELIPGGSNVAVRYEDRSEFIRLVQKARLEEGKKQVWLCCLPSYASLLRVLLELFCLKLLLYFSITSNELLSNRITSLCLIICVFYRLLPCRRGCWRWFLRQCWTCSPGMKWKRKCVVIQRSLWKPWNDSVSFVFEFSLTHIICNNR